jgi:hypothetical protein
MQEAQDRVELVAIGGKHYVTFNGIKIPHQIKTIVEQGMDEVGSQGNSIAVVTVTIGMVIIKDSK